MKALALAVLALLATGCRQSSRPDAPAPVLHFNGNPAWPEPAVAAAPSQGRLLITNNLEDTLSFFDVSKVGAPTLPELSRIPVGLNPVEIEAPHHAALSPAGDFYFVNLVNYAPGIGTGPHGSQGSGSVDGTLLKLRATDGRVVGTTRVDRNPGDLAISPDGKQIAVSHFDLVRITEAQQGLVPDPDARVLIINAETMEVTARVRACPAPHGIVFSADGARVFLACYSDEVAVVTLADSKVTRVKVASNAGDAFRPVYQPYALAVSPLTGDVFISCLASGEVRVLKADTLTIDEARTRFLGSPGVVVTPFISSFSADGHTLWVPTQGDDRISEVDPVSGVRLRVLTPASCTNIHQVIPAPDPRYLVAVCEGYHVAPGTVVVLDALSGATVSTTQVGVFPDFVGLLRTP